MLVATITADIATGRTLLTPLTVRVYEQGKNGYQKHTENIINDKIALANARRKLTTHISNHELAQRNNNPNPDKNIFNTLTKRQLGKGNHPYLYRKLTSAEKQKVTEQDFFQGPDEPTFLSKREIDHCILF